MELINCFRRWIQEKRYYKYIERHKKNVVKAFEEMMLNEDLYKDYHDIIMSKEFMGRIATHDMSKLDEEEFDAYRKNFYPINSKEKEDNREAFQLAWFHHWRNNSHHWQYRQNKEEFNSNNLEEVLDVFENIAD